MAFLAIVLAATIVLLAATPAVSQAQNGSIGVYFDEAGTHYERAGMVGFGEVFVIAKLAGPTAEGIAAAEFRVDGFPPTWQVFETPSPEAHVVVGTPRSLDAQTGGVAMAFPSCQSPPSVLLYTLGFIALPGPSVVLSVADRVPPTAPSRPWVSLFLCAGFFSQVEVAGGQAFMRGLVPV